MDDAGYGIYFVTDSQRVRLPVNPEELSIRYEGDPTTYNVAGVGEVVVPRIGKLATVEITSFFPRNSYTTVTATPNGWYKPEYYVQFFRKLQTEQAVFQLIVHRCDGDAVMFDTNIKAVLNNFEITDKGGQAGDVFYSMAIQEYRSAEPQKLELVAVDSGADTTYLTSQTQREVDAEEIVVGDIVTVTGPVFETSDEGLMESTARAGRQYLHQTKCVVSRVLPAVAKAIPGAGSVNKVVNRVYCEDVGWVNKADCVKGNISNSMNRSDELQGIAAGLVNT